MKPRGYHVGFRSSDFLWKRHDFRVFGIEAIGFDRVKYFGEILYQIHFASVRNYQEFSLDPGGNADRIFWSLKFGVRSQILQFALALEFDVLLATDQSFVGKGEICARRPASLLFSDRILSCLTKRQTRLV